MNTKDGRGEDWKNGKDGRGEDWKNGKDGRGEGWKNGSFHYVHGVNSFFNRIRTIYKEQLQG